MNKLNEARARIIKEQVETLRKYRGTGKLLGTYRTLIERQMDARRKDLTIDKSPWIIKVFEKQVNPAILGKEPGDNLDNKTIENAIRALHLFGKLMEELPEISAVNDYINVILALGYATTYRQEKTVVDDRGRENRITLMLRRGSLVSIIENTMEVMESWDMKDLERTMAKFRMLEWSVGRTSRTALMLEINGVKDLDENGLQRLHPTRDEIVVTYLNRGIFALGENGDLESLNMIKNLFEKLDYETEKLIELHRGNDMITEFIININKRIACSIVEQKPAMPDIIEALIRTGIRGIENLLGGLEKTELEKAN